MDRMSAPEVTVHTAPWLVASGEMIVRGGAVAVEGVRSPRRAGCAMCADCFRRPLSSSGPVR